MNKDLEFSKTIVRIKLNEYTTGVAVVNIEKTGDIEISEGF